MINVEMATHKDIEDVVEATKKLWGEHYYSKHGEFNAASTRNTLHEMVDGPLSVIIVARDGGELIGYIAFIVAPVIWGNVTSAAEMLWWVTPERRGEGVGKQLIAAGMEWASVMDCDLMELHNREGKRVELCGEQSYQSERAFSVVS